MLCRSHNISRNDMSNMSEKMKCALIDQIIQSSTELSVRETLSIFRLFTWCFRCGEFPHIASILPTDGAALTVIRPKYHTSDRDVRSIYGSERARWCLGTNRIAVFRLVVSTSPRVSDVKAKVQILSIKPYKGQGRAALLVFITQDFFLIFRVRL